MNPHPERQLGKVIQAFPKALLVKTMMKTVNHALKKRLMRPAEPLGCKVFSEKEVVLNDIELAHSETMHLMLSAQ